MIDGGLAALAGAADLLDRVTLLGQPPSFVRKRLTNYTAVDGPSSAQNTNHEH
jgi:hypothetical protein